MTLASLIGCMLNSVPHFEEFQFIHLATLNYFLFPNRLVFSCLQVSVRALPSAHKITLPLGFCLVFRSSGFS